MKSERLAFAIARDAVGVGGKAEAAETGACR